MINIKTIFEPVTAELIEFEKHYLEFIRNKVILPEDIVEYMLSRRGKRIRPTLVFLSAGLSGGVNRRAVDAAICVELMHNAALVHDDVVDQSFVRRNLPTFNAIWGDHAALLFGDYLMSIIFSHLSETGEYELIGILSRAFRKMSHGELIQMENIASPEISEEVYFDIIYGKTAALISACCESGAVAAGATAGERDLLKKFGEYIGIAYQIGDDLFDYIPDSSTGKTSSKDIYEKKLTLPLIHALRQSDPAESRGIINYFRNGRMTDSAVEEIIRFVDSNRGAEYARNMMNEYISKAHNLLESFENSNIRDSMKSLADYIANRDH
ncbi:MAG: polyprenyl synthetase family protein [Candidatus Kapaibacterium sp.]